MTEPQHADAWSPEDEPATREEARAYERFIRVLLREKDGQVPDALARKYLNTLLDPKFAKRHPRTHARMLENYHRMIQADHHLALKLPREEQSGPATDWQIHIHSPGELPKDATETTSTDDEEDSSEKETA